MNKYQTFDDLQTLGTEKIHEKTHISRDKVELLLTKSYGEIGRVQFMGFMSILEREFGMDLGDIRNEYTAYWEEHAGALPPKESVILQAQSNTKQKWMMAGAAVIALLLGGGYFLQGILSNEPIEEVMNLNSLAIEPVALVREVNTSTVEEANVTAEANQTVAAVPATEPAALTIRPGYKVWVGMIDMDSGTKTQQITNDPIVVDTARKWLIVLGHGWVEIETKDGKQVMKEKDTVRFLAENGTLKPLSKAEFTELNGGKTW